MGFELSVIAVVFFISAVLLGTFSYTMLGTSNEILDDASAEQYQMRRTLLHTDIKVENSTADSFAGNYNLTVTLSNTGSETLHFDKLNVLVDGNLESYTYGDIAATWTPAETRNLTITELSGLGIHRVKVVTENGISAYDSYLV